MPYKDPEIQKEYQNRWIQERRALFFRDKHCRTCKSEEDLTLDHIDPSQKWKHRIWSYTWEKIMKEAAKCQVLCQSCHLKKTAVDISTMRKKSHGTKDGYDKYHCRCGGCMKFMPFSGDEYRTGFTLDEAKELVLA